MGDSPIFILIASRGLIDFLKMQNIKHPIMMILDEIRGQYCHCQTQADITSVCTWAMECIERNYEKVPISADALLMIQRFWSTQPNLNAQMDQTMRRLSDLSIRGTPQHIPLPSI